MDKLKEKKKIESLLKIPVSDIFFDDESNSVQIISGTINMGAIPFYSVSGIITYETAAVNFLKWVDLYNAHKKVIDPLIIDSLNRKDIVATYGTFRRLYIKDLKDNLICTVICTYNNGWSIEKV